jgi:hypothetical protein
VQSLQDASKPAAECYPPTTRYPDMEVGSIAEMPVMPERSLRTVRADDQADRAAGNYAVQVGASGRGAVTKATNSGS